MKTALLLIIATFTLAFTFHAHAENTGYRQCASWDTFCKSPQQITATKCRLGVPVKHDQCKKLGVPTRYLVRGGGSMVNGMPVTELNKTAE